MTGLLAFPSLYTATSAVTTRALPIFEPFAHTSAAFFVSILRELLNSEVVSKPDKALGYASCLISFSTTSSFNNSRGISQRCYSPVVNLLAYLNTSPSTHLTFLTTKCENQDFENCSIVGVND